MRITLDAGRCTGHGRCYALVPALFDADDGGYGVVRQAEVPAGGEDEARRGVANCPEDAISVDG